MTTSRSIEEILDELDIIQQRIHALRIECAPYIESKDVKTSINKKCMERTEVQSHGFSWEKDLMQNVYGVLPDDMKEIRYTNEIDLPAKYNRLDSCDVSIKTTCNQNAVCMADCLRIYDAVSSGRQLHLTVVHYKQNDADNTKTVASIIEIDLTSSQQLLFGELTRKQLEELDKAVKAVPSKRKPTPEEYTAMYSIRDKLQPLSGAIHLDIKCNSTQSRLQCSFNRFQSFIEKNPAIVIARSTTNQFRGGQIAAIISSARRAFKKVL
jgi:hypothetical protein